MDLWLLSAVPAGGRTSFQHQKRREGSTWTHSFSGCFNKFWVYLLWSTNLTRSYYLSGKSVEASQCNPIPPRPSRNAQPPASSTPASACPDTAGVVQLRIIWLQDENSVSPTLDHPIPLKCLPKFLILSCQSSPVFPSQPKLSVQKPDTCCSAPPVLLAQVLLLPTPPATALAPAFTEIKNHRHRLLLPKISLGKTLRAGKENVSWKNRCGSHSTSICNYAEHKMGSGGTRSDSASFPCPTLHQVS